MKKTLVALTIVVFGLGAYIIKLKTDISVAKRVIAEELAIMEKSDKDLSNTASILTDLFH